MAPPTLPYGGYATNLRKYADIISQGGTPISAPAPPGTDPSVPRFLTQLIKQGFAGAATRAASDADRRKKQQAANFARAIVGAEPVGVSMPERTGPLASLDRFLGFGDTIADDGSAIAPALPALGKDGQIDMGAVISAASAADVDPVAAVSSVYALQKQREEAQEATRRREVREMFAPGETSTAVTINIPVDGPDGPATVTSSIDLNNPFNLTQREKMLISLADDTGRALNDVLDRRVDVEAAEYNKLKDQATISNTLRDDFSRDTKSWRTVIEYAESGLNASDNQIGDVTLLYAYIKSIDPDSVVRTGEVELTKDALIPTSVLDLWASLSTGRVAKLSDTVRRGLREEIRRKSESARAGLAAEVERYDKMAEKLGVESYMVTYDPVATGLYKPLPPLSAIKGLHLSIILPGPEGYRAAIGALSLRDIKAIQDALKSGSDYTLTDEEMTLLADHAESLSQKRIE